MMKFTTMTTTLKMTKTDSDALHEHLKSVCLFFADYAANLLACGATSMRTQRNVARMAAKWNVSAQMIILPNTVDMCVWDADGEHSYKQTVSVPHKPISFAINTKLSNLSWLVVENSLPSFDDTRKAYQKILDTTRPVNKWLVMILVMFANASFCRLFGGDFQSMGIVALATLVGYYLKIIMLDAHADMRIVFICCSFVSAVIGTAGYVFGIGSTPELALGASVLYLIPGIPYINSVSDMIDNHHLCAFARFVNAVILTVCIAIGLTGGFLIMNIRLF